MKIDSAIFRLHTNATVILLVTFSIAVTTRQYVGNPIDCVHTRWDFSFRRYYSFISVSKTIFFLPENSTENLAETQFSSKEICEIAQGTAKRKSSKGGKTFSQIFESLFSFSCFQLFPNQPRPSQNFLFIACHKFINIFMRFLASDNSLTPLKPAVN